jgi:acyl-CoA dehydrogenase
MNDRIDAWLRLCPDPATDPLPGMQQAGLLDPLPDYAAIARIKAAITERTGLLGLAGAWGGRHLVARHFLKGHTGWEGKALSVAISEPEVGAHPKLLTTTAEDGTITGRKAWVSNFRSADGVIVFAITAVEQGRKRYSAFIVPCDAPGLTAQDMPGFHALRPSRHCLLTLDRVPATEMLGEPCTAYERLALPFRDVEDAVGTFAVLGALRHATARCDGADPLALGGIVALTAVYEAAAEALIARLDAGRMRTGDATLVGLRVLALDMLDRLRALNGPPEVLSDLAAVLNIARGPRMARQTHLGDAALRRT